MDTAIQLDGLTVHRVDRVASWPRKVPGPFTWTNPGAKRPTWSQHTSRTSIKQTPLIGNSDHLTVMLTPAYKPRVKWEQPVLRSQNVATGCNSSPAGLLSDHTAGHLRCGSNIWQRHWLARIYGGCYRLYQQVRCDCSHRSRKTAALRSVDTAACRLPKNNLSPGNQKRLYGQELNSHFTDNKTHHALVARFPNNNWLQATTNSVNLSYV